MTNRNYKACLFPVSTEHGQPPVDFLNTLIDTINPLPDSVFERNDHHDVYSVMLGALGPYEDLLHRKAVMCETLRVIAAFESDWKWNEGVDVLNPNSVRHKEGEETGAFQVSWDSMSLDDTGSLSGCVDRLAGNHEVDTFITQMKLNHPLAVEYCVRLLRINVSWCGTLIRPSKVISHVRRDAVEEFKSFLTLQSNAAVAENIVTKDVNCIPALLAAGSDNKSLQNIQRLATTKLLQYDGEIYPHDGCAITLSLLLQQAGIGVPDTYQALELTKILKDKRKWKKIKVGNQTAGDIGTTCGDVADHGKDHIYLVLKKLNDDEMLIADNQENHPHFRWASGQGGKTPTKYFLRAV